ncbi:NmrA family NAD(P)-binding protein [Chitinibacter bivalviorum]|uniref:NmrA family NAD(P)-binding protein n=1 Tax=Chitinibacter bivalviorum TaxID=2739434 RepID=A0A7H9BM03_9NEIS|nr:NAD-dependent epimerase/dehydratase family protein [Chitinibacter bivalviorum]QLG89101.1 NmrA family NAD(P)-binding protein [Chitinibacter bivalviorum]
MAQQKTVLILGAAGRFGAAAVAAFAQAGWQVKAQARRAGHWPAGVVAVQIDAMDREALIETAMDCDVIVNALNPLYTEWPKFARPLAAHALAAAQASGALLMFPGNVYNFGRHMPSDLQLNTPQIGDHEKAKIRIEIEQAMQQAHGVDSVVVRAGDYFGAGTGSWFDEVIIKDLHKNKVVYPGPSDIPHAWAYLPDLAASFVLLAEQRAQLRGAHTFHFAGHTFTGQQLRQEIEAIEGRPLQLGTLPWGILKLIGVFAAMPRAIVQMRYLWQRPHQIDGSSLPQQIGVVPHTPLNLALRATLAQWAAATA